MKTWTPIVAVLVASSALLAGCTGGGGGDDGVKSSVNSAVSELNDAAVKSGGKWSNLTPEQQKKFLDTYQTEDVAKKYLGLMAHPPNLKSGKPK